MTSLRETVRKQTLDIHKQAENSPLMFKIIKSTIKPTEYLQYLVDIYNIYRSLHITLSNSSLPHDSNHHDKVKSDIVQLCNMFSLLEPNPSISCQSYCSYLSSIQIYNDNNISRFMAHIYVRYFADLSGGKILSDKLDKMGYPIESYKFNSDLRDQINDWINHKCVNPNSFIGDSHVAFLSYDSMLNQY